MNLDFAIRDTSENLSFAGLLVTFSKLTFFDGFEIDTLARLLQLVDHIICFLFDISATILLFLLLNNFLNLRLFFFNNFLGLWLRVNGCGISHNLKLLLHLLYTREREVVLDQIFQLRDVVLEVELREITR